MSGFLINTTEQNSYDFVLIPPNATNMYTPSSNFSLKSWANKMDGISYLESSTAGHIIKYRFRGRRIGILIGKASGNGQLAFDVDGVAYGTVDTSSATSATVNPGQYNIPYIIATDLLEDEHILTITKLDSNYTLVGGFLVDNASYTQVFQRSAPDYHTAFHSALAAPTAIGTADTTLSQISFWTDSIVITNTTAAIINVTLKNLAGTVVAGPFPIPANDIRVIQAKMYFAAGVKAIASATGCIIALGGQ